MKKIMENSWFKKGLDTKQMELEATMGKEMPLVKEADKHFFEQKKPDFTRVLSFNAFDIITLSTGFDLSGLFVENDQRDEVKFTSTKPASDIISKMEEIATSLKMEVGMKKGGQLNFKRPGEGRNGPVSVDVEIFEIASNFHLVEVTKSCGDALEYQKILKNDIRPALQDIVWAWHGE